MLYTRGMTSSAFPALNRPVDRSGALKPVAASTPSGRINVNADKLWDYRNPANRDAEGRVLSGHLWWGTSSFVDNGTVQVGDLVNIFNTREASYRSPIGSRSRTATRREVADVLVGDDGTITIKVRQIGSTSTGKGYRRYTTDQFQILRKEA